MQYALSDSPWDWSKDKLPGKESDPGRSGGDNRRFIEAILWVGRNGARWRAIPNQYGHWNSIYRRFRRWSRQGLWQMIFNTLAAKADTEWLMLDSTIVRAHQHAAGAKGGPQNEALGRSRGGFSTKLQAVCDALGHALRLILTGGQAADCKPALALLDGLKADAVWADKGYDANYLIDAVSGRNALVVIPPKANRKIQRPYDTELYQERNLVERLFNKLKHFRRVATRYDKTALSFMSFLNMAAISLWLK
jgi:transposase